MEKEILKRHVQDMMRKTLFAKERTEESLPVIVYRHNSLIRRRLGNVNMQLQENKATNLALAVKHIDGLLIRPGETFSVWRLIGRTTKRKGYKEGLTIAKGKPSQGIGGGMCQLSNLIHWLVLHSELTITEYGTSSPRRPRPLPRFWPTDSLRHRHQHLVQLYRLPFSQRHSKYLSAAPLDG